MTAACTTIRTRGAITDRNGLRRGKASDVVTLRLADAAITWQDGALDAIDDALTITSTRGAARILSTLLPRLPHARAEVEHDPATDTLAVRCGAFTARLTGWTAAPSSEARIEVRTPAPKRRAPRPRATTAAAARPTTTQPDVRLGSAEIAHWYWTARQAARVGRSI